MKNDVEPAESDELADELPVWYASIQQTVVGFSFAELLGIETRSIHRTAFCDIRKGTRVLLGSNIRGVPRNV